MPPENQREVDETVENQIDWWVEEKHTNDTFCETCGCLAHPAQPRINFPWIFKEKEELDLSEYRDQDY